MASAEERAKRKKSRQEKLRKISLIIVAIAVGFIHSASTTYLRELYNIKSLVPWGLQAQDFIVNKGDFAVLTRNASAKIFVDNSLLVIEQTRQMVLMLLIVTVVYLVGKSPRERISLFLFVGGLAGVLYHMFLYALLHWPGTMTAKDVVLLMPNPIIAPFYAPLLLCALALTGGTLMLFKKS